MRVVGLYLALLFFVISLHAIRPIIALYADIQDATPFMIAMLVSSYAFFPMILSLTVGKWMDRFGCKKVAVIGSFGMFLSILIPLIFPNLFTLFISQIILGLSQVSVLMSYQKTIGNIKGDRDKLIMWFSLIGSLGELIGPLIGGFSFEKAGFRQTMLIAAIFIVLSIIIALIQKKESWQFGAGTGSGNTNRLRESFTLLTEINLRKAFIASGLVLYSKDLFIVYFPIYGSSIGLTPSMIGIIISISGAFAVLIRFFQYYLVHYFGRMRVLFATLFLSGLAFAMIPFTTMLPMLFILSAVLGAGLGLGQPISLVYTFNFSAKERHGEVLGMRLAFNRGTQFLAPFFFGAVGGAGGIMAIYVSSGMFLIVGGFLTKIKDKTDIVRSR